jgi:hypothetical protein
MDVFDLIGGEMSDLSSFYDESEEDDGNLGCDPVEAEAEAAADEATQTRSTVLDKPHPSADAERHGLDAESAQSPPEQLSYLPPCCSVEEWRMASAAFCMNDQPPHATAPLADHISHLHQSFLALSPLIELSRAWRRMPGWPDQSVVHDVTASVFERCSDAVLGRVAPPPAYVTAAMDRFVKDLEDAGCSLFPENLCALLAEALLLRRQGEGVPMQAEPAAFAYRCLFFHETRVYLRCSRVIGSGACVRACVGGWMSVQVCRSSAVGAEQSPSSWVARACLSFCVLEYSLVAGRQPSAVCMCIH